MIKTFIDLAPSARRDAQGWWSRSSRQSRSSLVSCSSNVEPPAAHRDAAAADADGGDRRAGAIDLDVEDARPADLEPLLAPYAGRRSDLHQLVRDEVRPQRTLSRTCRRVFANSEAPGEHASVHMRTRPP